ncbi:MAG: hypothetical protein ABWZ02_01130, partial [Nakamurella sp.]
MRFPTLVRPSSRRRRLGHLSLTSAIVVGLFAAGSTTGANAQSAASTQIAKDSFDRSVGSGLASAALGGAYTTTGDPVLSVSGGAAKVAALQPGRSVGGFLGSTSSLDTSISSSVVVPKLGADGTDMYYALEARRQSDGSAYRGKLKVSTAGVPTLSFSRTNGTAETLLGKIDLPLSFSAGQTVNLQFQVKGTNSVVLDSRAWVSGSAQPAWQHEFADTGGSVIGRAGAVGFWSYSSSSGKPLSFAINEFTADKLDASTAPDPAPAPAPSNPTPTGKPTASNTGVPSGTTLSRYTGPLTITTNGTVIDGKAVYGDLKIQAANVVIRNSYLHCGTEIPAGNSGCIDANSANVQDLLIENNTIIPDRPSYYRDGIVGHEFNARYNEISRSNDGIQIQGGNNIAISGNNVVGSVVAGDGLGTYGYHGGAALIVNQ